MSMDLDRLLPESHWAVKLSELEDGAAIFVWTLRQWAQAARSRVCMNEALAAPYVNANCPLAITLADEMFCLLSAAVHRPIDVFCHHANHLSADEERLVLVLQALERQQAEPAQTDLSQLIVGPLNRTFCRIAVEYIGELKKVDLSCIGIRKLRLVD